MIVNLKSDPPNEVRGSPRVAAQQRSGGIAKIEKRGYGDGAGPAGSARRPGKLRGGSWNDNNQNARASYRNRNNPNNRNNNNGFRLVVVRLTPYGSLHRAAGSHPLRGATPPQVGPFQQGRAAVQQGLCRLPGVAHDTGPLHLHHTPKTDSGDSRGARDSRWAAARPFGSAFADPSSDQGQVLTHLQ